MSETNYDSREVFKKAIGHIVYDVPADVKNFTATWREQKIPAWDFKRINIPSTVEEIEPEIFMYMIGTIITIPEDLWKKNMRSMLAVEDHQRTYDSESSIIYKVLMNDGNVFFSYSASRTQYEDSSFYEKTSPKGYYYDYIYNSDGIVWDSEEYIQERDNDIDELPLYEGDYVPLPYNKILIRLCRLATPLHLSDENRKKYATYLKRYPIDTAVQVALFDSPELLRALFENGIIKKTQVDEVRDILAEYSATECLAVFEDVKNIVPVKIPVKKEQAAPKKEKATPKKKIEEEKKEWKVVTARKVLSKDLYHKRCLALKLAPKHKHIDVEFPNGRKYNYMSRYEVDYSNRVIIGTSYVCSANETAELRATSGLSGKCRGSSQMKKKNESIAEISFVFSNRGTDIDLTECANHIIAPDNKATMQWGRSTEKLYPITHMIRKNIAALTILQLPEHSGTNVEIAEWYLNKRHIMTDSMYVLNNGYAPCLISLNEFRSSYMKSLYEEYAKDNKKVVDGYYKRSVKSKTVIIDDEQFDEYIDKCVLYGTAEVLIKGHADNLLKIYLEKKDASVLDRDVLRKMAEEFSAEYCLMLLNDQ